MAANRPLLPVVLLLVASAGGVDAVASDARLGVSVRVLPSRPAPSAVMARLPIPPDTRRLTANASGGSYHFPGQPVAASQFYRSALPGAGFRLVRASRDGAEMVWEDPHARVELLFDPVLGAHPATRITVNVQARRAAAG